MLRFHPNRFGWLLVLTLGLWAVAVQAQEFRYRYISLDSVPVPSGFFEFSPRAIDDKGRVYGNIFTDDSFFDSYTAVYEEGAVTILQPGSTTGSVNKRGTIGGLVDDPETGGWQAALFRKNQVKLIPKLPGSTIEYVLSLNASDTALVWSEDPSGLNQNIYRLYKNGKTTFRFQLPTGSDCARCWGVNNRGIVAGTILDADLLAFRAIRFQHPYRRPRLLDPLPADTDSQSFGINNTGYILGVSTSDPFSNPIYSIGLWDQKGNFETYIENSIFYAALFNDKNLIVLTENFDTDFSSYIVPRPGVQLNIEDLVVNPASIESPFVQIIDINNRGDMVGYGLYNETTFTAPRFLLERIK